jgi:hypothetical protein
MKRLSWGAVGLIFLLGCNPDRRMDSGGPVVVERAPSTGTGSLRTSYPTLYSPSGAPPSSAPGKFPDLGLGTLPDPGPPNFGPTVSTTTNPATNAATPRLRPVPAPAAPQPKPAADPLAIRTSATATVPRQPVPQLPVVPQPVQQPLPQPPGPHLFDNALASAAPTVRMVNGRRLRINYAVKDSNGVTAPVELWYTRDGKTWQQDSAPPQLRSPYVMELKDEGIYGLTLVAAADGPGARPQPGDVPQFWVAVDWTRPAVNVQGVEIDAAHRQVNVRWSANDTNLAPRPITISYAATQAGPWTPLAANLHNSGHYSGPLPAGLSGKCCVRVEAIDQGGNIGEAHTTTSVPVEHLAVQQDHRARIVSVENTEE